MNASKVTMAPCFSVCILSRYMMRAVQEIEANSNTYAVQSTKAYSNESIYKVRIRKIEMKNALQM